MALVKGAQQPRDVTGTLSATVMPRSEALQALRDDYQVNYFVSGAGEMTAYEADCVFADPFVSFKGDA